MADVDALMDALPVSGLETHSIALIKGFVLRERGPSLMDYLTLLEPPAARHAPYIEPVRALRTLLKALGYSKLAARDGARAWVGQLRVGVADERWVNF